VIVMAALTVEQALAKILTAVEVTPAETIAIESALGRILAAPLTARLTQPPFDASAMDGYAVRAADVASPPVSLRVIGEAAAGHPFSGTLAGGQAVRIFTGAPLPEDADAIVIQENCERAGADVVVRDGRPDRDHVRLRGSDFTAGDRLLPAGRPFGARELSLAASTGYGRVPVHSRPRVGIIATGDELVLPGETPGPGQIVCSNHLGIHAMCGRAGADVLFLGIARDTRADLDAHLARASACDIVITIGGASVGDHDLVAPALQAKGVNLDFWKIAMRPGKPLMFGRLGAQRFIGLPGNPVSSLICTRLFIVPLIRAMLGLTGDQAVVEAVTSAPLEANGPRAHYVRATRVDKADGTKVVTAARSQDSSLLSVLADANCLIVRPISAPALLAGARVPTIMLDF
jgi:molybdopterin molybdotransferase